ncbi:hypothetical protein BO94DRAFT_570823 [Aspergillus sclerotioniger CBS 115572]|uniref:Uncharacterized protein n=1 Tax=Aspergillus sclerotioniger CBS 115572 TaxID=1450535 RepID=A0A317XHB8_9EURO|nr:hypothetical protein BO94DRAFT_570823 [Aspergillus sclerotioniger CBS 115572]PWY96530.1 hypothetical protein BO94DRAFT_570823 [Aspergillus sclerotioniger CBS 115572]
MLSIDYSGICETLVKDLQAIGEPDFPNFCNRLHNKAQYSHMVEKLRGDIDSAPNYPPDSDENDWHSQSLDGLGNADYFLSLLSNCGFAHGVLNVDDRKDKHGYKKCLAPDNVDARCLEAMSMLLAFCLGEWINSYLASKKHRTLKDLRGMEDFEKWLYDWLKDDDTIEGLIWKAEQDHDWRLPTYLMFVADYLKYQPGSMPGYGEHYTLRPSYQILQRWSRVNYKNHTANNPQMTDDHVIYCGKLSTISFVPETSIGIIQPTETSEVMKGFYHYDVGSTRGDEEPSDQDYSSAILDSLVRLSDQENVINQFKSWIETISDNYQALHFDKWNHAVDRSFSQEKWTEVNDWITNSRVMDDNFHTKPDLHLWKCDPWDAQPCGSQFMPQTRVHVAKSGATPIEKIRKGDMILCSANPERYEAVEQLYQVSQEVTSVGFNGEPAFTTVSQVFETTTGLRAVDPRAAHALNPFQRVGRLAVGHCIYRLHEGLYQVVELTSIDIMPHATQPLYRVSLRGDVQYHHANGYLVACNDPVYSARSIADQLQHLPPDERQAFLASCKELSPIFRQHDIQTIKTRLDREIYDLQHAPWRLSLDKQPLSWTPRGSLNMIEGRFQLTACHEKLLPFGYQLPDLVVVDGRIVVDGQVIMHTACDENARTFRWTRKIPHQHIYEHAYLRVYPNGASGSGVVYLTVDADPRDVHATADVHPFRALAICPTQESAQQTGEGPMPFTADHTFQLQFDKEVWPADVPDWNGVKSPVDGGNIIFGSVTTEEGYSIQTARIPLLDDLQQKISKNYNRSLEPLYRATQTYLKNGNVLYTVQMHRASWMPFLAENWNKDNNFNVTFKSELNVDLTLPCLFQELKVEINALFPSKNKAVLLEYNPSMRGMKGNRHYVSVTKAHSEVEFFQRVRAKISRAFVESPEQSLWSLTANDRQPAEATAHLDQYQSLDVPSLIDHHEYNDQTVHNATQAVIQNMMLYHMNQDDRETFTQLGKPGDLPVELADGLSEDIKTFLRTKYAPAWLCQSFVASDKYASKFTDKEKKKLWYWWHGNGKNCLAQATEYNEINKLASMEGVKTSYKTWITPYLQQNSQDWAQRMLNVLQVPIVLDFFVQNPIQPATGVRTNIINQQAMIMHVLDPSNNLPDTWWQKIMAYTMKRGLESPTMKADQEEARQFLESAISTLIIKAISPDGTIPGDVQMELLNDVEQYETDNNLDHSQSAEKRAANIVGRESNMLDEASKWATGAAQASLDEAYDGASLYQWVNQAFNQIQNKYNTSKYLKGIVSTGMVGFRMFQVAKVMVGLVNDWNDMTDGERSKSVLELLQDATKGLDNTFETWKIWKGRTGMYVVDQVDTMELDQGTYRAIDERAPDLAAMGEEVSGEDGLGPSIGEHVAGDGVPTEVTPGDDFNNPPDELPDGLSPAEEESASEFRIQGNVLKILSAALGLGIAVAMTFNLVHDWDNLSTFDKVMGVLSVVVQFLTVALDIADVGISTGLWAVSATLAAAIPVAGWVLIILGVLLTVISFLVHLFGGGAPPDPVEKYIDNTGKPLLAGFTEAADPLLNYSLTPSRLTPGRTTQLTVIGTNNTDKAVSLAGVSVSLYTGDDDSCVFSDTKNFVLVDEDDPNSSQPDHVYVSPQDVAAGSLPFRTTLQADSRTYYRYELQVGGSRQETRSMLQQLVLKPAARFSAVWTGTVSTQGSDVKVDVVEKTSGDMSHALLSVSLS